MAIAAIFFALSSPSISKLYEAMQYQDAVRGLFSAAKNGHRDSLIAGKPIDLIIDVDKKTYWLTSTPGSAPAEELTPIADSLTLDVTFAEEVSRRPGLAAIRFFPGGGSTGGEIRVSRPNGSGVRLTVDWLLGDVTQDPL